MVEGLRVNWLRVKLWPSGSVGTPAFLTLNPSASCLPDRQVLRAGPELLTLNPSYLSTPVAKVYSATRSLLRYSYFKCGKHLLVLSD
jgi:hypothetical protein